MATATSNWLSRLMVFLTSLLAIAFGVYSVGMFLVLHVIFLDFQFSSFQDWLLISESRLIPMPYSPAFAALLILLFALGVSYLMSKRCR